MFYGQTDLLSRVCRLGVLFVCLFFLFLVAKITLKTHPKKKSEIFCRKILGKYLTYLQVEFLYFGQKTADFTRFWGKNLPKRKYGSVAGVKEGFFFFLFCGLT